MSEQPNLFACIEPATNEIVMAWNKMADQWEHLEFVLRDLTEARTQKQAVSVALAAEDVAKTALQIQELASAIHRGVAKRLELEARL